MGNISVFRRGTTAILEIPYPSLREGDVFFHEDGYWLVCDVPPSCSPYADRVIDGDGDDFGEDELQHDVKRYVISDVGGYFYIPNALHVEPNKMLDGLDGLYLDSGVDVAKEAVKDGIKLIDDMHEIPVGVYIDTPDNRWRVRVSLDVLSRSDPDRGEQALDIRRYRQRGDDALREAVARINSCYMAWRHPDAYASTVPNDIRRRNFEMAKEDFKQRAYMFDLIFETTTALRFDVFGERFDLSSIHRKD